MRRYEKSLISAMVLDFFRAQPSDGNASKSDDEDEDVKKGEGNEN